MGIGQEEFPALSPISDKQVFEMEQKNLLDMLKSVSYAQSHDENRYILNGVYFSYAENTLTLVATDGRRLGLIKDNVPSAECSNGAFILPAKTASELERLLGVGKNLTVSFNDCQIAFDVKVDEESQSQGLISNIHLVSKAVDGSYPNYNQVIPKETTHRVKLERELLLECLSRAALVTNDKNNAIRMKISPNNLEINGSSPDLGESQETLAIEYEGPVVTLAFNPQFLIDPLRVLTKDQVYFEFKDELSPGVFKTNDNFLCVIMPLRINN